MASKKNPPWVRDELILASAGSSEGAIHEISHVPSGDLRSLASQLLVDTLLVETHYPAAPYLDHRHARLPRLTNDVPCRVQVALYVNLLERHPLFFEITFRPAAPGARGRAEQHNLSHQTTSLVVSVDLRL